MIGARLALLPLAALLVSARAVAPPAAPAPQCGASEARAGLTRVNALRARLERLPAASRRVAATRARLLAMRDVDQVARDAIIAILQACPDARRPRALEALIAAARAQTARNRAALRDILARTGWPVISVYGREADQAGFLIAQHSDDDHAFQREVLARLEPLAARGDTAGENFALLYDRVAEAGGRPQRFGSQGECRGKLWEPDAIEDPAQVDRRRAALGLEPMAAYASRAARALCGAP
ncbi:MAG: hypothetical protein JO013_03655 [Alphaproteobacteria bacterium]|nr:hypothetical protein [Alphaproteobacteria bacterium]